MDNYYKVRSIISTDEYYTSNELIEKKKKYIDIGWFIPVKKNVDDRKIFYIREDSLKKI